ncbi:SseB family protein [Thermomonospora amylolytica]|uniref:SseB family protein n=1 Tax=Thermomonospora amylolytica TaxID=1411117 RepID=UPI001F352594|nr:hypothetical protein [Thermomonospora amylolytica]
MLEWSEFAQRLGRELAGLDRDTILIVRERAESRHYVQAMREPDRLYAEAVSNHFLEGPLLLTPADEEVLREVGWKPPGDPSPRNWWTDLPGHATPGDHFRLADMMVQALRDVQGVRRPSDLVYESFHRHGNGLIELLGFGISPADPARVTERRTTPDPVAPRVADPVLSAPVLPEDGPHAVAPGLHRGPAAPPAGPGFAPGELELALTDAKQRGDHMTYFDLLLRSDLVLPLPQGPGAPELVTTTIGGATYVLAFSSTEALTAALSPKDPTAPPPHRRLSFGALAAAWPDPSWSLAINTGLPSEMHLDALAIARLDHTRRTAEQAAADAVPPHGLPAPNGTDPHGRPGFAAFDPAQDPLSPGALPGLPSLNGHSGPSEGSSNGHPEPMPNGRVEPPPGGLDPLSPNGHNEAPPHFPGPGAPGVFPPHDTAAEAAERGTHAHGLPDLPLERPPAAPHGGSDLPSPNGRSEHPHRAADRGMPPHHVLGPLAPAGRDEAPHDFTGLGTPPHGLPGLPPSHEGTVPSSPSGRDGVPQDLAGPGTPPHGIPGPAQVGERPGAEIGGTPPHGVPDMQGGSPRGLPGPAHAGERPDSTSLEALPHGVPGAGSDGGHAEPPGEPAPHGVADMREGSPRDFTGPGTPPHGLPGPAQVGERSEAERGGTPPHGVPGAGTDGGHAEPPGEPAPHGLPGPALPGERPEVEMGGTPPHGVPGAGADGGPAEPSRDAVPPQRMPDLPSPEGPRDFAGSGTPPHGVPQPAPAEGADRGIPPRGVPNVPAPRPEASPGSVAPSPAGERAAEAAGPLPDLAALTRLAVRSESIQPENPPHGEPAPAGQGTPPHGFPQAAPEAGATPSPAEDGQAGTPPRGLPVADERATAAPPSPEEGPVARPDEGVLPPEPQAGDRGRPEPGTGGQVAMRLPHGARLWVDAGDGGEPRPVAVYDAAGGGWTPVAAGVSDGSGYTER